jgi:hypothetical protein
MRGNPTETFTDDVLSRPSRGHNVDGRGYRLPHATRHALSAREQHDPRRLSAQTHDWERVPNHTADLTFHREFSSYFRVMCTERAHRAGRSPRTCAECAVHTLFTVSIRA